MMGARASSSAGMSAAGGADESASASRRAGLSAADGAQRSDESDGTLNHIELADSRERVDEIDSQIRLSADSGKHTDTAVTDRRAERRLIRGTARSGGRKPDRRLAIAVPVLAALLIAAMITATGFGAETLPVSAVLEVLRHRVGGGAPADLGLDTIVWQLRVPRTVLAAIVGAGLALAGAAMQTLVRNPLADPYLLGVSSGAGVGAAAVITSGLFAGAGVWALSGGALLGAFVAAALVFLIAVAQGGLTPLRLVLTGTVLGSAFAAFSSYLIFRSTDPAAAQSVLFWLLGSLAGADWTRIALPLCVVALSGSALLAISGWLDALTLGTDTAAGIGVPVKALRIGLFLLLAVLVGVLVAVSGGIGFVGLVIPHAARLLVGPRHRGLLPVCALSGALFLVIADAATRVLVRPTEIPVGVLTGLIGAPAFLILLGRRRYRFGES